MKQLLQTLAAACGVSGDEGDAAKVAADLLREFMPVRRDALGSVVGTQEGEGTHILLDAHLDQIGMVVTAITPDGFLKLAPVGGCDIRTLAAAEVTVYGKQQLLGVISSTPPHLAKDGESDKAKGFDSLAVDIGFTKAQAEELVAPGDRVTLRTRFTSLAGTRCCGTSFDDRAGVAAVLRCVQLLREQGFAGRLSVLLSAQEETGGSGAAVGGYACEAQEGIAVDVSFGLAPGLEREKCADIGKGPMVGFAPTLDYAVSKALSALAKQQEIPFQTEVMGGKTGTNADSIQTAGRGVKMGLLSIPLRNMHTGVELLDLADIENTARLMAAYVKGRDKA